MQRSFATSAVVTLLAGLLFGQSMSHTAQAQRAPDRMRNPALTAPPLISAPGAEVPVTLRSASVDVETNGSLARTTLLLTLYNPNDRLLEGTLQFPLQAGQQVSAFALDVGGVLRDAVPVPKQKAQQVFESIERRQVDPGLLEQTAGNHFRLRVYPIPARGTRQVRLVIDEAMRRDDGAWRLDVPMHLLAEAGGISMTVRAHGLRKPPEVIGAFDGLRFERKGLGYTARYDAIFEREAYSPGRGLSLRLPGDDKAQSYLQAFDNDRFVLIEIPMPDIAARPRVLPKTVGLLWDASASGRKRDHAGEFALLDRYFKAMGTGEVSLRILRDEGEPERAYAVRDGDWSALRTTLAAVVYDGASDLADWAPEPAIGEYLLVSDGLHNYGEGEFAALGKKQALYALNSAGARSDSARLAALAEARGGRLVAWQDSAGLDAAAKQLLERGTRVTAIEGSGITDLQPQAWSPEGGLLRIAGRLTEPTATVRVTVDEAGAARTIAVPVTADAPQSGQIAGLWAHWRIAAYAAEPERHRADMTRLGQRFGIVTPGTSLLVLEAPEDYVRYDIPAPAALHDQVAALRRSQTQERQASRSERLEAVAARFAERQQWYARRFPKGAPPQAKADKQGAPVGAAVSMSAPPPPPSAPPPAPMEQAEDAFRQTEAASAQRASDDVRSRPELPAASPRRAAIADAAPPMDADSASAGQGVSIRLQPWVPDSPYARRLRGAKAEDIYALYLDERDSHADSTAFYLDVADLLLQKGRRAEGLRVLSNLAELELENRHILRVLGYRLVQAKDWRHGVYVFREVLRLADEEPQSHRDLGLALAQMPGARQEAIERLYEVAARPWDSRFSEVELVALNEMNAIIAASPTPLDTAFIDRRLIANMPLDLRVVLSWDSDNSDMDLWVTDPNGERCYYGNKNTYQGGLISDDFTGGYGPEEFVLRDAKPGKYKVEANFFGDRQQIVTGATTLNLMFSTGWGTRRQQDQRVALRLSGSSETVFVGEFEVK